MTIDPILEIFIKSINKLNYSFPVTLNVEGITISGVMISYSQYLKENSELFSGKGEMTDVFSKMFLDLSSVVSAETEIRKTSDKTDDIPDVKFIHLKEAVIYGEQRINMPHWRGRIETISGFSFGKE